MKWLQSQEIIELFKKYDVEGFVNISFCESKELEYSPLYDETSVESSNDVATSVTLIKKHKKAVFSIDGYSLEKIESAFQNLAEIIEFWQYDEDIMLPEIHDSVEKNFSNPLLESVDFSYLETQLQNVKDFPFQENISIEAFSIWVHNEIHVYINSYGAVKVQKDNGASYLLEIVGMAETWNESHYKYATTKNLPDLNVSLLWELQNELLHKMQPTQITLEPWMYDIAFEQDVVIEFLDVLLGNLWAESMREWLSLFSKNIIWDKVVGENVTIVNNPELPNYTWNLLFDREWVTQKRTVLIENGVLKTKFCDYKNVLKEWKEYLWNSTISNIEIIAQSSENYLDGTKFLFTHLMWLHTLDRSTWKFSLNGEWYIIENGVKGEYMKNIAISWDVLWLFNNIKAFGNDWKDEWNIKVSSMSFYNQKLV